MILTHEEQLLISDTEGRVASILSALQSISKFKVGDFLIAFKAYHAEKQEIITNSYGAVKKFQVIFIDRVGIPYMKELNKKGMPVGNIIPSIKFDTYGYRVFATYVFEIDPDYTDAIILDDQENYDAAEDLKAKSDAFKAVAKHNKSVKISNDERSLLTFIKTLSPGSIIWRSYATSWIVQKIDPLPKQFMKASIAMQPFITIKTNKGEDRELSFLDLKNISIYKDRPKTYKELKDPK